MLKALSQFHRHCCVRYAHYHSRNMYPSRCGRVFGRHDTSSRFRNFRNAVPHFHHKRVAPAVQRPVPPSGRPDRMQPPMRRSSDRGELDRPESLVGSAKALFAPCPLSLAIVGALRFAHPTMLSYDRSAL